MQPHPNLSTTEAFAQPGGRVRDFNIVETYDAVEHHKGTAADASLERRR